MVTRAFRVCVASLATSAMVAGIVMVSPVAASVVASTAEATLEVSAGGLPSLSTADMVVEQGWDAPTRFSTAHVDPSSGVVSREVSSVPVNFRGAGGEWEQVDPTLTDSERPGVAAETTANSFRVLLPQDAGSKPVRVDDGDEWVTLRLLGAVGAPEVRGTEASFGATLGAADSVSYAATPSGVKESVVIESPPAADGPAPRLEYSLRMAADLRPVEQSDGSIEVRDGDDRVVFEIPAPTMMDSAVPEQGWTDSVSMAMSEAAAGEWTLVVRPDPVWLLDPDRVYPVVIDPTIIKEPGTLSCWLAAAEPGQEHCGAGTAYIRVGRDANDFRRRGLVKFGIGRLTVPAGAEITGADLRLFYDGDLRRTNNGAEYVARKVTTPWTNQASWNNSGTEAWSGGDFAASSTMPGPTAGGGSQSEYKHFDVERILEAWMSDPGSNEGFLIKQAGNEGVNNDVAFISSESSNAHRVPKLVIDYLIPPTDLRVDPCSKDCAAPWRTASVAPELSAAMSTGADASTRVRFEVRRASPDGSVGGAGDVVASGDDDVAAGERGTFTPAEDLEPGASYHFRAGAVLDEGDSEEVAWSDWAAFSVAPDLPGGVWLPEPTVVWDRGPALTWDVYEDPSSAAGDDLAHYQVIRGCVTLPDGACTNPATSYDPAQVLPGRLQVVATLPPSQTEFTDTTATPASPTAAAVYRYWVVPQTRADLANNTTGTAASASVVREVSLPRQGRVRRILTGDLADATLVESKPGSNFSRRLEVDSATDADPALSAAQRGVIRFDATEVRRDLQVTSARVELNQTTSSSSGNLAGTFELHRMERGFDEDAVSWNNAAGSTTPWTTAGGDYDSSPVATTSTTGAGEQRLAFADVGTATALRDLVQSWVEDPAANHGFAVTGNGGTPEAAVLVPSESGELETTTWTELRPRLVVEHLIKSPTQTFESPDMPQRLLPQDTIEVPVTITNTSDTAWAPGLSALYYWMTPGTETVAVTANAAAQPLFPTGNTTRALQPGEPVTVTLSVNTPPNPPAAGYDLWVDLVDSAGKRWSKPVSQGGLGHPYYTESTLSAAQLAARDELLADGECATMPTGLKCPDRTVSDPSSNGIGLETFGSYAIEPTGGGGQLATDLSSGNLAWTYNAFANPSRGPGMFLRATFNTLDPHGPAAETGTGRNWSFQAAGLSRMHSTLAVNNDNDDVSLIDGDGTTHTWAADTSTTPTSYRRPAGVHLELRSYQVDGTRRYVFSDPAGTQYYYDDLKRPSSVVDLNGNTLTFHYQSDIQTGSTEDWRKLDHITDDADRTVATFGYLPADGDVKVKLSWVRDISGRFLVLDYGLCSPGDNTSDCVTSLTDTYGTGSTPPATPPVDSKTFEFSYGPPQTSPHWLLTDVVDPQLNSFGPIGYYKTNDTFPHTGGAVPSDLADAPRQWTDQLDQVTQLEYKPDTTDGAQRRADVYDHHGAAATSPAPVKTQYAVDGFGRTVWLSTDDPNGDDPLTTSLAWDGDHNVTRLTQPNGATARWHYDAKTGYPVKAWDPVAVATGGSPTRTSYAEIPVDHDGSTGPQPGATGHLPSRVTTPRGNTTTIDYDAFGNPTTVTPPGRDATEYGWWTSNDTGQPLKGVLKSITDPRDNVTSFAYPSGNSLNMGLPRTVTPPGGDAPTSFTYDNRGNTLTAERAAAGQTRTTTVDYDAFGRPTSQTTPGTTTGTSRTTTYAYDRNDNVKEVIQPNEAVIDYSYDARNRLIAQTLPGNGSTGTRTLRTAYDPLGRVCREAAPLATLTGTLTCQTPVAAHVTGYRYDTLGRITHVDRYDDTRNQVVTHVFGYDRVGNVVQGTDPNGHSTTAVYDDDNRVVAVTDAAGYTSRTRYDADGQVSATIDQAGNPVTYTYTPDGLLKTISTRYTPDGSTNTQTWTTKYGYDQAGNRTRVTHPRSIDHAGESTPLFEATDYDANNRPIQTRAAFDPSDTTPVTSQVNYTVPIRTHLQYNAFGELKARSRPTRTADPLALPANEWTTYTHWPSGEIDTTVDPHGITTRYKYNELGQQSQREVTPAAGTGTRTMTWDYYPDGSLQQRQDTATETTRAVVDNNTYGGATQITGWQDWDTITPADHNTDVGQEGPNYRAHPAAGGDSYTWNLTAPEADTYTVQVSCPSRAKDANNNSLEPSGARATAASYTITIGTDTDTVALNQAGCITNPGWRTLGDYQAVDGQRVSVKLASTASGVVVADAARLRQAQTTRAFTYAYDANGNQTGVTDTRPGARVDTIATSYDSLNRPETVTENDSDGIVLRTTGYGYDPASNLTSVDAARSAQGSTTPDPSTEDRGNLALTQSTTYTYDPRNLLATVTANLDPTSATGETRTWKYTWDPRRQLATITKPANAAAAAGNTTTFRYYEPGMLKRSTERTAPDPSGATRLVASHRLAYDPDGNRISDVATVQKPSDPHDWLRQTAKYTYTPRGQLARVAKTQQNRGKPESYTYDDAGNIIEQTVNTKTTNFTYTRGRLNYSTSDGVRADYTYDGYGRLTRITANLTGAPAAAAEQLATYTYDGYDRVIQETHGKSTTKTTRYDPLDRPTIETVTQQGATTTDRTTRYNYLGTTKTVAAEERTGTNGTWRLHKNYITGPGGTPLALRTNPETGTPKTRYYSLNPHGDTEALTDPATGNTTTTYRYTSYGQTEDTGTQGEDDTGQNTPDGQIPDSLNPYRFNSDRTDPTTGDIDMGFRTYRPGINNFLTPDYFNGALANMQLDADPWNTNRYTYAGGNPITRVELDGHYASSDTSGSGATGASANRWHSPYRTSAVEDDSTFATAVRGGLEGGGAFLGAGANTILGGADLVADVSRAPFSEEARHDLVERGEAIAHAVRHPVQTAQGVWTACKEAGTAKCAGTSAFYVATIGSTAGFKITKLSTLQRARAPTEAAKTPIGFAEGLGKTALTPGRLQHGTKNLTKAGVLPAWSGKNSPGIIERAFVPILERPTATFDHTLGGTRVRGFLGDIDGNQVAVFVYKEGPYQGQLASSYVPSPNQLKMWGVP